MYDPQKMFGPNSVAFGQQSLPQFAQYAALNNPGPPQAQPMGSPMDIRPPAAKAPTANALGGSGINPLGMMGGILPMMLQGLFGGGGNSSGGEDPRRREMMAQMLQNRGGEMPTPQSGAEAAIGGLRHGFAGWQNRRQPQRVGGGIGNNGIGSAGPGGFY